MTMRDLDAAKRDGFTAGYLIAVANIVNLHGEDVIAKDVLQELGATERDIRRLGLTDYDAEPLRALFRDLKQSAKAGAMLTTLKGGVDGR